MASCLFVLVVVGTVRTGCLVSESKILIIIIIIKIGLSTLFRNHLYNIINVSVRCEEARDLLATHPITDLCHMNRDIRRM